MSNEPAAGQPTPPSAALLTGHWSILAIDPTDDVESIRRAYRARLRTTGPETDPEGFQRLREAYEAVLAAIELRPSAAIAPQDEEIAAGYDALRATVRQGLANLDAHRAAGDEAGAIAGLNAVLATLTPGSRSWTTMEDALLQEVALTRSLSPALFLHLVDRFDWRDAQGRAARADPERHAVLLDRVAAEEWLLALRQEASGSEGHFAAVLLAPAGDARQLLPLGELDAEARNRVRDLFGELRRHGRFLLQRFDGAALALLREAVEGPPLLGDIAAKAAPAATGPWGAVPNHAAAGVLVGAVGWPDANKTRRRGFVLAGVMITLIVAGVFAKPYLQALLRGDGSPVPAATARAELDDPAIPWLALSQEPGGTLVDWSPLITRRRAIADVRYGANTEEPNAVMPLPENGTPIRFVAPAELTLMTVRLRFPDGTWSATRRYPINSGPRPRPSGAAAPSSAAPPSAVLGAGAGGKPTPLPEGPAQGGFKR